MRLNEISAAIQEMHRPKNLFSILLYGNPKTGKTRLAATIAKVPWIKNVYYIDIENGSETMVTMLKEGVLTTEEATKIVVYKIPDTKPLPMAYETVMKMMTIHKDLVICEIHGKVSCVSCAVKNDKGQVKELVGQPFNISKLTNDDVIVIDSGSALGDSILNYYMNAHGNPPKPGWDEYGPQGLDLQNLGLIIQAGIVNVIMVTHTLTVEVKENDVERDVEYPLVGTKNCSKKFGKYFGHVMYLHKKLNMHKAGSSSTYQPDVITGSRAGWKIETEDKPSFEKLFAKIGVNNTKEVNNAKTST